MVEWNDSLSVGVAAIDEQHRNLFKLINRIEASSELSNAEMGAVVDALLDYAQIHFQTEEEFFYRFNYLEKTDHEREHGEFVSRAVEFSKRFEQQGVSSEEIHAFLLEWMTGHIKGSDMKFKGLFTE